MDLVSLNDDVLRQIFSYFHGENALKLSLTCRRVHDLAIERVAAVILCQNGRDLRLAHRYMFFGARPRIQYLESLTVEEHVYEADKDVCEAILARLPPPEGCGADWNLIRLVLDLLMNAPRLRRVKLGLWRSIVEQDARVAYALFALPSLTTAYFENIDDRMVALVRGVRRVRHLYLNYHDIWSPFFPRKAMRQTLTTLVNTLAFMPLVQTLRIDHFDNDAPSPFAYGRAYRPPLLPGLRRLMLWRSRSTTLDLVQLCPNVSSVEFSLHADEHNMIEILGFMPRPGARWPPLRFFRIEHVTELGYVTRVLGRVHHFAMDYAIDISELQDAGSYMGEEEVALFVGVVRLMSPVGMFLRLEYGPGWMGPLWKTIAPVAPRLRYLELELKPKWYGSDVLGWMDTLPKSLESLGAQLLSLRIVLPRMVNAEEKPEEDPWTVMEALQEDRAEAVRRLPRLLACGLPELRFLGLCEAGPFKILPKSGASQVAGLAGEPGVGDEEMEAEAEVDSDDEPGENEEDRMEDFLTNYRRKDSYNRGHTLYRKWWRIRRRAGRGVGRVALEEMSREQADRVQTFLENSDLEQLARICEVFL